jgi:small nuclear ribonucleoprotein (snRNP)-like protein
VSCLRSQAYDGHMNLILSDVEETIMLVDGPDGVPSGQGVVNVRPTSSRFFFAISVLTEHPDGKKKDGDAFCKRRWGYTCAFTILCSHSLRLNPPSL